MILLWCLSGFTAAWCIGRYNQSNKLFWILFTSFVLGIAGASVYNKYTRTTKSEVRMTQVCPTQEVSVTSSFVTLEAEPAKCNLMPALVSKEKSPEYNSNIIGHQWVKQPIIPPPRQA